MSWVLEISWSCTSFEMDDSKILESFDSNIREEFWNLIPNQTIIGHVINIIDFFSFFKPIKNPQ